MDKGEKFTAWIVTIIAGVLGFTCIRSNNIDTQAGGIVALIFFVGFLLVIFINYIEKRVEEGYYKKPKSKEANRLILEILENDYFNRYEE